MRLFWCISVLLLAPYLGAGSNSHIASRIPKVESPTFKNSHAQPAHAMLMNLRLLDEAKACSVRERLKQNKLGNSEEEEEEEEYEDSCMQQFLAAAEIYARRKAEEAEQALQRLRGGSEKDTV
jgi:hypothetical protein